MTSAVFHDGSFGPEATHILGEGYERACALIGGTSDEELRRTIAKRILDLARGGEMDPGRLCEAALGATPNSGL
jgi:hypothetical protein